DRERQPVEIIELHGAVELAPRVGLADGIMDLVMTGRTLRDNLLVEVAAVFRSTARLVVNRGSLRLKAAAIRSLIARLEEVIPAVSGGSARSGSTRSGPARV
ncbi:MAG: ATP phosphoribosyltransferase, partial [Armatimonadetes bacterium]|nr:ATP phosphoribosyltransferase [Armatimonadota bacterium]